ncbi:MAG: glycosyl hydrolase family 25 [Phascolarctobacterium sp.]|nr:MAG: glycosyl hydrolase family 25 [Phascolarctobacterium sp.]
MKGIDVSENNGIVRWDEVAASGAEFAIIRLGYGNRHLDGEFYNNVNGALAAGIKIGVYYYSYALDADAAAQEAKYALAVLKDCGFTPDKLAMGMWFDMEDADGYKATNGVTDRQTITDMCSAFIVECNKVGYSCGIYANLDWLQNRIATEQLADYVPYWCAQWGSSCDWPNAKMWQHTDHLNIGGTNFDGNFYFE